MCCCFSAIASASIRTSSPTCAAMASRAVSRGVSACRWSKPISRCARPSPARAIPTTRKTSFFLNDNGISMTELLSVMPLGLILFAYLLWGFRVLPRERWQFIATLPLVKDADGHWRGVNLTYYGFFSAVAYVVAVVALLTLLGASRG